MTEPVLQTVPAAGTIEAAPTLRPPSATPRRIPAGAPGLEPLPGPIAAEQALPSDAPAVAALIDQWAADGLTIARTVGELAAFAEDFTLAVRPAQLTGDPHPVHELVACGAAHLTCSGTVAEVRSVCVSSHASGLGAGRTVMHALIERSRDLGTREIVLLTRIPAFFERFGFRQSAIDDMPPCYLDALAKAHRATVGRTAMRLPLG